MFADQTSTRPGPAACADVADHHGSARFPGKQRCHFSPPFSSMAAWGQIGGK